MPQALVPSSPVPEGMGAEAPKPLLKQEFADDVCDAVASSADQHTYRK
jgi:hypothetical protein